MIEFMQPIIFAGWLGGIALFFPIRSKLKANHPQLYDRIFAKSILEHNISKSLQYAKFALSSVEWRALDDPSLVRLLQVQRICFFIVVTPFIAIIATLISAAFMELMPDK
ncbi:MAG: hypothetical protein V7744_20680 [Pseudomonadales bacterium]